MSTNELRLWVDKQTPGFTRDQKKRFKEKLAEKLLVSYEVFSKWYMGCYEPQPLQKKAVNMLLQEEIFKM